MNEVKDKFTQKVNRSMQIFQNHLKQVEIEHSQREIQNQENAFKKFEKFVI